MLSTLFYLLAAHCLADFTLQSGPMAVEKCRHSTSELQRSVPWYYWLSAHALIHGGLVGLVMNSAGYGLLETIAHWVIDFAKCEGWTNIHVDQALHIACKVLWVVLAAKGVTLKLE